MIKKIKWTWKKVVALIAGFLGIGTLVSCYGMPMDVEDISINGTVTSSIDNTPIKDIAVDLRIDNGWVSGPTFYTKVYTNENGYYEINTYCELPRGYKINKGSISFYDEDGEANGGYFRSNIEEFTKENENPIHKDVILQKCIPITVGGIVTSAEDSTPIKNITVSSEIDKTITDETGYYELRATALKDEAATIYFNDDDGYSNGGHFSFESLSLPLEKDNTFDNNISLKKIVEDSEE